MRPTTWRSIVVIGLAVACSVETPQGDRVMATVPTTAGEPSSSHEVDTAATSLPSHECEGVDDIGGGGVYGQVLGSPTSGLLQAGESRRLIYFFDDLLINDGTPVWVRLDMSAGEGWQTSFAGEASSTLYVEVDGAFEIEVDVTGDGGALPSELLVTSELACADEPRRMVAEPVPLALGATLPEEQSALFSLLYVGPSLKGVNSLTEVGEAFPWLPLPFLVVPHGDVPDLAELSILDHRGDLVTTLVVNLAGFDERFFTVDIGELHGRSLLPVTASHLFELSVDGVPIPSSRFTLNYGEY